MYAVFVRGTSQIFPEDFTHIAAAAETAGLADKSNIFSCIGKHITGCLYAVIFYIFCRTHMQAVMKKTETFPLTGKSSRSDIFHRKFFTIMFVDIDHHQFQTFISFVKFVFSLCQWYCKFKDLKPDIRKGGTQFQFIARSGF